MIIQEEKLLTVRETANYLQLTDQTIRRWINTGKLNAVKIGKEFRIRLSELNEILN
jgi:excisionase family DNA binding protein